MNKKDLVRKTTERLRDEGIKKPISTPKHKFHITDDEGNKASFTVKQRNKTVIYTVDDVENILDACIQVITESLRAGEPTNIHGFGNLFLHYREARKTKIPSTDIWCDVDARFTPKFNPGNDLKMAARLFELDALDVKADQIQEDDQDGT